eukprot:scaffold1639_cov331-Pavlova_lutheri.AAC.28
MEPFAVLEEDKRLGTINVLERLHYSRFKLIRSIAATSQSSWHWISVLRRGATWTCSCLNYAVTGVAAAGLVPWTPSVSNMCSIMEELHGLWAMTVLVLTHISAEHLTSSLRRCIFSLDFMDGYEVRYHPANNQPIRMRIPRPNRPMDGIGIEKKGYMIALWEFVLYRRRGGRPREPSRVRARLIVRVGLGGWTVSMRLPARVRPGANATDGQM